MTPDSTLPLPVSTYVLFHPKSEEGAALAESVFRWLRLKEDGSDGTSAGLPVYFRANLATEVQGLDTAHRFSPPLRYADAHHNVLVLLVDDLMATERAWREAARALVTTAGERNAEHPGTVHLLPVMVSKSFAQLAFLAERHNPVRIYSDTDPADRQRRVELRGRRLRRHLTEAMIRVLRGEKAEPLKVFISHAKIDGVSIATRLRDGLAAVSQLQAWFDVNDLRPGVAAASPMKDAAAMSSGGMIAVISDAYSTRPWCRYEALQARMPRQVKGELYFRVQPTVVVDVAENQWTRGVGAIAQVQRIGWPPRSPSKRPSDEDRRVDPYGAEEQHRRFLEAQNQHREAEEARIVEVVDRLLLEVLLHEVVRIQREVVRDRPKHVFLGFIPDAWTLTRVRAALPDVTDITLVYPGHGLRRAERDELNNVVRVVFGNGSAICPLEDLLIEPTRATPSRIVALTASGENRDLLSSGVGQVHINDFSERLARHLLIAGHRVAYGGTLTNENSVTQALIDVADGWRADLEFDLDKTPQERVAASDRALESPPMRNYAAWPTSDLVTPERRGRHLGVCGFVEVDPAAREPGPAFRDLAREELEAHRGWYEAEALSAMRARMSDDCDVRIMIGGRIHGWLGWVPGIAEELVASVERGKPVLILGAYGGCCGVLATFLRDPKATWPDALTYEAELEWRKRQQDRGASWNSKGADETTRRKRFDDIRTELTRYRDGIHHTGIVPGGVPFPDWRDALTLANQTELIRHVLRVLRELPIEEAKAPR